MSAARSLERDLMRRFPDGLPLDAMSYREARALYAAWRGRHGAAALPALLLTDPEHNAKFAKTKAVVYGLALAQHKISGWQVCPFSSPE